MYVSFYSYNSRGDGYCALELPNYQQLEGLAHTHLAWNIMYTILGHESVSAVRKLISVLEWATFGGLLREKGYSNCTGKNDCSSILACCSTNCKVGLYTIQQDWSISQEGFYSIYPFTSWNLFSIAYSRI